MIELTRINGKKLVINSDLIEHIESNPDTIIKLTSGNKFVVREDLREIISKIVEYKGTVLSISYKIDRERNFEDIGMEEE